MSDAQNPAYEQFLQRIDRRIRFLKNLSDAGLAVYLPADESARKQAFDKLATMTARPQEIAKLPPDALERASASFKQHLEAQQNNLPHDVQYRNRIRRAW